MSGEAKDKIRLISAAVLPPMAGSAFVYLAAAVFGNYGWTLFVIAPAIMGFISTVIYAPRGGKPFWKCLVVGFGYFFVISLMVLAFAIEGLVCVFMALPLAIPVSIFGVFLGWLCTNHLMKPKTSILVSVALLLTIPFTLAFEISDRSKPAVHAVVSAVEIDAPIEAVWKNVIEFPQIDKAPAGILRLGFAYPVNAGIEGAGVGAVRRCNFNTGSFVEPITAWEAPNLLAFDVADQPPPMIEMTPYDHLFAAHLDYLRSEKGQFRLYERDGKTILEGTTFYTHSIAPDIYWRLFSDEIIHQIHLRVLDHIKEVSEKAAT
jgi:hypothetical protein